MEEGRVVSDEYTQDGTVDLKGKLILKSKSGGWKACSFLVVYEVFERMAYYGISSNLILYLTKKLHQGTVTSSNNVTNWVGTIWITPILGAYLADAHLGRYWTFLLSSIIYLLGMALLTLSVSLPSLKPPECHELDVTKCEKASTLHLAVFYGALYTLALGTGGTKPNISTIGVDQFDDFDSKEKKHKLSFFNWWMFSIFIGTLFANSVLVYIQDNVGWTLGYALPTLGLAISIVIFLAGTPFYRHKLPSGSPFTKMAKVIMAAIRKWKSPIPRDTQELYELDSEEYAKKGKVRIDPTPTLRFLNKASVKTDSSASGWKLSPVTHVEETKQMLRMIPIWMVTFIPSAMIAQIGTLFVKQGITLDRGIGSFTIPQQRFTKNPRGITLLQRIGIGLIIHIVIMVIASLTERYRLRVAKEHGLVENGGEVPLSIFILLPQYILMGTADAFLEVAKIEFFYDQAPESMKSLGTSYSMTALGIGNFLSTFILSTVSHVTEKHGHKGWVLNNLNASHLDYYYALLAILNLVNLIFFMVVAKLYVYRAEISDSIKVLGEELKEKTSNQVIPRD
ncbi:hypothetical protein ACSQ67_015929 [Phaseolus vulgaris]